MRGREYILAALMALVFGMGWVFTKSAMSQFPPILLAAFRFSITALTLIWFVRFPRDCWCELVLISVLAIGIPYSLSYTAMSYLDVPTAVLLAQLEAPAVILVAAVLLRERPTFVQIAGIALSFTGVVVLAGVAMGNGRIFAVGLALVSTLAWSLGQIRIRRLGELGGLRTLAWASLFAAPQLVALSLVIEKGQLSAIIGASTRSWMEVAYLGVVMTALGIGIWYHLLGVAPVVKVAPFLLLVPPISIAGGYLMLGEELAMAQLIGGVIIVAGVGIVLMGPSNAPTNSQLQVDHSR